MKALLKGFLSDWHQARSHQMRLREWKDKGKASSDGNGEDKGWGEVGLERDI